MSARKIPIAYRIEPDCSELLERVREALGGLSYTRIVENSIRMYARRYLLTQEPR